MTEISCDVCLDLMPLVRDGLASGDSATLVRRHLAGCPRCARAFEERLPLEEAPGPAMDEKAVLGKIQTRIRLMVLGTILAGALLGLGLAGGMGLFYNVLILPAIGGAGYWLLRKRAYLVPLGLFGLSFVWVFIREALGGFLSYGGIGRLLGMAAWWAALFAALGALGVFIAALLRYAFKREG